jgi:hypothetical protein
MLRFRQNIETKCCVYWSIFTLYTDGDWHWHSCIKMVTSYCIMKGCCSCCKACKSGMIGLEWYLGSSPSGPDAPRPYNWPFVPPWSVIRLKEPCSYHEVPDGPFVSFLISSGSKKKEPRCACLSEAKDSTHTQNVDWGFLLSTSLPTNGIITRPLLRINIFSCCVQYRDH